MIETETIPEKHEIRHTTYANSNFNREQWLSIHPDGEYIVCDAFPEISFIDNSVATQQSLIARGLHDLLRPLYKEITKE